ncbi:MAG: hypothetical protein HC923_03720 [Myxococcales bacterium]|nr:hypothetical protein [Myxococcales bacterium]
MFGQPHVLRALDAVPHHLVRHPASPLLRHRRSKRAFMRLAVLSLQAIERLPPKGRLERGVVRETAHVVHDPSQVAHFSPPIEGDTRELTTLRKAPDDRLVFTNPPGPRARHEAGGDVDEASPPAGRREARDVLGAERVALERLLERRVEADEPRRVDHQVELVSKLLGHRIREAQPRLREVAFDGLELRRDPKLEGRPEAGAQGLHHLGAAHLVSKTLRRGAAPGRSDQTKILRTLKRSSSIDNITFARNPVLPRRSTLRPLRLSSGDHWPVSFIRTGARLPIPWARVFRIGAAEGGRATP